MAAKDDKDNKDNQNKEGGSEPTKPDNSNKGDKTPMIPKHRFDELSAEVKQLKKEKEDRDKLEAEEKEKQLKKEKKFEELSEKYKAERDEAIRKSQEAQIDNLIQAEAVKKGIKDVDAALKLIDRSGIKVNDDNIEGVSEAVDSLVEGKPYLKDAAAEPSLGSGANPPSSSEGQFKRFKLSDIQNPEFYKEHEKDIDKAMGIPGAIIDDLGVSQAPTPPTDSQS